MKRAALILLLCTGLLIAGCGDDDSDSSGSGAELNTKPTITVPDGSPPKELVVNDLVVGTGPEAKPEDIVTTGYMGVGYESGKEVDSTWDGDKPGIPITIPIGNGSVIDGWDEGMEGMQVGGRRELIIPPDLAYGKQGQPPLIEPNETLIFVIDLLAIEPAEESQGEGQQPEGSSGEGSGGE